MSFHGVTGPNTGSPVEEFILGIWLGLAGFAEIEAARKENWRGDAEDGYRCCSKERSRFVREGTGKAAGSKRHRNSKTHRSMASQPLPIDSVVEPIDLVDITVSLFAIYDKFHLDWFGSRRNQDWL
jgi:hypothetical protein